MNNLTTISTKGQVTIPQYIRELLDIQPGDKAVFKPDPQAPDQVIFQVISSQTVVDQLAGSLHQPQIPYTPLTKVREAAGRKLAQKYQP
jgi:AbrB family looped-hinge helix DNA binding protein